MTSSAWRTCSGRGVPSALQAVVIEDAVGDVGVLLDLAEDHARADGVRCAGGNEKCVAGVHGKRCAGNARRCRRRWRGGSSPASLRVRGPGAVRRLRARQPRTTFRSCRLPSAAFVRARVFVVGMDLHRELVLGEDEFDQQRDAGPVAELACRSIPRAMSAMLRPVCARRIRRVSKRHCSPVSQTSPMGFGAGWRRRDRRAEPGCARPRCAARRSARGARGRAWPFTWRLRRRRRSARGAAGLPRCAPWTWRRRSAGSRARQRRRR